MDAKARYLWISIICCVLGGFIIPDITASFVVLLLGCIALLLYALEH